MNTMRCMFITLVLLTTGGFSIASSPANQDAATTERLTMPANQLLGVSAANLNGFRWLNEPGEVSFESGVMRMVVAPETDFFINPENGDVSASAPVLYREVTGDFVASALVKPDFSGMWNAAALMVMIDNTNWIKFAFENSDATSKSIVSVVTRDVSDDANGVRLPDHDTIWLRLIRKGNNYAMHWSSDGSNYKMARLAQMPAAKLVKVGLEAQSPVGKSVSHEFLHFSIETRTVADLRAGK